MISPRENPWSSVLVFAYKITFLRFLRIINDVHARKAGVAQCDAGKRATVAHVIWVMRVHGWLIREHFNGKLFRVVFGAVANEAGLGVVHRSAVIVGDTVDHRKPCHRRFNTTCHKLDQIVVRQP